MNDQPGMTPEELAAEGVTALPDKEVVSILDLNADLDIALDVAAPVDLAVAANANVAAPINAAASASFGGGRVFSSATMLSSVLMPAKSAPCFARPQARHRALSILEWTPATRL